MDEIFDFVIVGSGGGSMCAALVLRQAGQRVLILEKTELVGGTTAKSGGVMWIPNNRFMAEAGIGDSEEQALTYLNATVGEHPDAPGATKERQQAYVREASKMVDFLVEQGVKLERAPSWPDYYDERPGGSVPGRTVVAKLFNVNELGAWSEKLRPNIFQVPLSLSDALYLPLLKVSWRSRFTVLKLLGRSITAKLTGKRWVTAGAALQGRMLQTALKAGVEIRTEAAVREIIVQEDTVAGVLITREGRDWRIGARLGVLLNAGGFSHNAELRKRYIPDTSTTWSLAAPGDTGDMHEELIRMGAAMAQMNEMVGNQMSIPPGMDPQSIQMQLAKPHAFLVDQTGQRYLNEGGSYMEFCQQMLARHRSVPAIPSWMIMDSRFIKTYMLASSMPGAKKPQQWFDSQYLRMGQTLDELASACSIDAVTLKSTVARFNQWAHSGQDEDFHRGARAYDRWLGDYTHAPNPTLGAIETAPFYAVPVVPGDVGTYGGAVTDCCARVLREDGTVIKGLYATGTTTASVMGHAYPGAGSSIGPSFTWGYVAAKHATGLLNETHEAR